MGFQYHFLVHEANTSSASLHIVLLNWIQPQEQNMPFIIENLSESIRAAKVELRAALPQYNEVFRDVEAEMRKRVNEIVKDRDSGQEVIPIVQYTDVANDGAPADLIEKIKSRGACVIRGTFPKAQAEAWDQQVA